VRLIVFMQLVPGSQFVLQQQCCRNFLQEQICTECQQELGACALDLCFCAQLRQQRRTGASDLLLSSRHELASTSRLVNGWSNVGQTWVRGG
jgi:hypothetical protein